MPSISPTAEHHQDTLDDSNLTAASQSMEELSSSALSPPLHTSHAVERPSSLPLSTLTHVTESATNSASGSWTFSDSATMQTQIGLPTDSEVERDVVSNPSGPHSTADVALLPASTPTVAASDESSEVIASTPIDSSSSRGVHICLPGLSIEVPPVTAYIGPSTSNLASSSLAASHCRIVPANSAVSGSMPPPNVRALSLPASSAAAISDGDSETASVSASSLSAMQVSPEDSIADHLEKSTTDSESHGVQNLSPAMSYVLIMGDDDNNAVSAADVYNVVNSFKKDLSTICTDLGKRRQNCNRIKSKVKFATKKRKKVQERLATAQAEQSRLFQIALNSHICTKNTSFKIAAAAQRRVSVLEDLSLNLLDSKFEGINEFFLRRGELRSSLENVSDFIKKFERLVRAKLRSCRRQLARVSSSSAPSTSAMEKASTLLEESELFLHGARVELNNMRESILLNPDSSDEDSPTDDVPDDEFVAPKAPPALMEDSAPAESSESVPQEEPASTQVIRSIEEIRSADNPLEDVGPDREEIPLQLPDDAIEAGAAVDAPIDPVDQPEEALLYDSPLDDNDLAEPMIPLPPDGFNFDSAVPLAIPEALPMITPQCDPTVSIITTPTVQATSDVSTTPYDDPMDWPSTTEPPNIQSDTEFSFDRCAVCNDRPVSSYTRADFPSCLICYGAHASGHSTTPAAYPDVLFPVLAIDKVKTPSEPSSLTETYPVFDHTSRSCSPENVLVPTPSSLISAAVPLLGDADLIETEVDVNRTHSLDGLVLRPIQDDLPASHVPPRPSAPTPEDQERLKLTLLGDISRRGFQHVQELLNHYQSMPFDDDHQHGLDLVVSDISKYVTDPESLASIASLNASQTQQIPMGCPSSDSDETTLIDGMKSLAVEEENEPLSLESPPQGVEIEHEYEDFTAGPEDRELSPTQLAPDECYPYQIQDCPRCSSDITSAYHSMLCSAHPLPPSGPSLTPDDYEVNYSGTESCFVSLKSARFALLKLIEYMSIRDCVRDLELIGTTQEGTSVNHLLLDEDDSWKTELAARLQARVIHLSLQNLSSFNTVHDVTNDRRVLVSNGIRQILPPSSIDAEFVFQVSNPHTVRKLQRVGQLSLPYLVRIASSIERDARVTRVLCSGLMHPSGPSMVRTLAYYALPSHIEAMTTKALNMCWYVRSPAPRRSLSDASTQTPSHVPPAQRRGIIDSPYWECVDCGSSNLRSLCPDIVPPTRLEPIPVTGSYVRGEALILDEYPPEDPTYLESYAYDDAFSFSAETLELINPVEDSVDQDPSVSSLLDYVSSFYLIYFLKKAFSQVICLFFFCCLSFSCY